MKKIAPWLVAAAIFVYLFREYPPARIYKCLIYMNVPFFVATAVLYMVLMLFLDTFSISRVLARFGHKEPYLELLPARGTTYLLMVLNYAAGQAAFAFYQYRKYGLPIAKMLGIFSIIVVADLYILVTLAFITTFFTTWPFTVGSMSIAQFVRLFAFVCYALFAVILLLGKIQQHLPFVARLRKNRFIDLIASTRLSDYLIVGLARLPVHIFIMCGMYIAIHTFNVQVPFVKVLANIPLVFFIGSLPITPGGLGASNMAIVELFKPFITGAAITAGTVSAGDLLFSFSLVWIFANYSMKALTGIICLKFVSKDLFEKPADASPAEKN